ncbi:MAG: hypothetical protein PUB46_01495 [Lachnospiraceae bacterium]|nr:hypothetical protein [Lachnospiraceae bacterium]
MIGTKKKAGGTLESQRRKLLLDIVEILARQGLLTEEEKLKVRMFIS